jgi:hypothetical protein
MNPAVVNKTQNTAVRTLHRITADASGKLPSRIALVPSGKWVNSVKGDIEITVADLNDMVDNFNNGIGLPDGGSEGAPIDFSHNDWAEAGAWIKKVEVIDGILYATEVEWSDVGAEAIKSKRFKFISPSFYPACIGSYYDPEDPTKTAQNVLVGAGFTNIPFFKGLTGLKASTSASAGDTDSTIFISAETKGDKMDFATARAIKPAELTDEARQVLADNKDKLTAAELIAFGLEEGTQKTEKVEASTTGTVSDEDAKLLASIKDGSMKLVEASEHEALKGKVEAAQTQLADIRKKEVAAAVKAHVARGAIKADAATKWESRIIADATVLDDLAELPDNSLLASEAGQEGGAAKTAKEEMAQKIEAATAAAKEAGTSTDLSVITASVRKENAELAAEYDKEIRQG